MNIDIYTLFNDEMYFDQSLLVWTSVVVLVLVV